MTPPARTGALDLRLVTPAVVVWSVTLAALFGPGWLPPAMAAIGATTAALLTLGCVRGRVTWRAVGLVIVGAAMVATCATAMMLRIDARDGHPLAGKREKTTVTLTVRDDPRDFGPAQRGQVVVAVSVLAVGHRDVAPAHTQVTGDAADWSALIPGQRVSALVAVRAARPGTLDVARLTAKGPPRPRGRPPPAQRLAAHIRGRLQQNSAKTLGPDQAGLLPGLVLGDESSQSRQVHDDFRAAGLSHLTAVSGANFAIVCGAAIGLVRLAGASPRTAAVAGFVVIVAFVIVVRPSPSVIRAAMMGAVGLLALLSSRSASAMPALGVAVVGGLLWWPELAREPGFALSVAATAGLVLLAPRLRDRLRDSRVPRGIAELVAIAVVAHVITAPLVALISGTFSVVSVLANVMVAPVVGLISVVGVLAAVVGVLGDANGPGSMLAALLLHAVSPEVSWMVWCARTLGGWHWAVVDIPDGPVGALLVAAATAAVWATGVALARSRRSHHRG